MTNVTNLQAASRSQPADGRTTDFFNNFFQPDFTVSQNVDDVILGFFEKIAENKEAAKILASSVIYTSVATGIDPMETLEKFRSMDSDELNIYVTTFLNLNRTGTSFLGINNQPQISKYVQRMIRP